MQGPRDNFGHARSPGGRSEFRVGGWERRLLIVNANKLEWGVEIELSRIPAPFLFTAGTWGM